MLWAGSFGGAAVAFLTQVLAANSLTTREYGIFASVLATMTLLVPLAGCGIPQILLKVFGEEGTSGRRWLKGSAISAVSTTSFVALTVITVALWFGHDLEESRVYLLLLPFLLGQVMLELGSSVLQLEERYGQLTLWQLSGHLLRLTSIMGVITLSSRLTLTQLACIYSSVGMVLTAIGGVITFRLYSNRVELKGHNKENLFAYKQPNRPTALLVTLGALPYGAAGFLHLVYFQSSVILLAHLAGRTEAAEYNVAFLFVGVTYLLPSTVYQKYLQPKLHRWAHQDPQMFLSTYRYGCRCMFALGAVGAISIWVCAPFVIPILFGEKYSDAAFFAQVLGLCAPLRFVSTAAGSVLLTRDNMKRKLKYMSLVAVFSVGANFLLIPAFGIPGALITTVASEVLLLAFYLIGAKKYVFKRDANVS